MNQAAPEGSTQMEKREVKVISLQSSDALWEI